MLNYTDSMFQYIDFAHPISGNCDNVLPKLDINLRLVDRYSSVGVLLVGNPFLQSSRLTSPHISLPPVNQPRFPIYIPHLFIHLSIKPLSQSNYIHPSSSLPPLKPVVHRASGRPAIRH